MRSTCEGCFDSEGHLAASRAAAGAMLARVCTYAGEDRLAASGLFIEAGAVTVYRPAASANDFAGAIVARVDDLACCKPTPFAWTIKADLPAKACVAGSRRLHAQLERLRSNPLPDMILRRLQCRECRLQPRTRRRGERLDNKVLRWVTVAEGLEPVDGCEPYRWRARPSRLADAPAASAACRESE